MATKTTRKRGRPRKEERLPKVFPYRTTAVEGRANTDPDRIKVYTTELPAEVVARFVADQALTTEGGFQRPLDKSRASRIGRLMAGLKRTGEEPQAEIHNGLLAFAHPDEVEVKGNRITLKAPLHWIDGQHRGAGAAVAVDKGLRPDYTESVRIVLGATHQELSTWYLRTNMEARKVPPSNQLINIADMTGVVNNRKSWVARITRQIASEPPFVLEDGTIVSWVKRDGGLLSVYSLYKAINRLLPEKLNREGDKVEDDALKFARKAFVLYASLFENWGRRDNGVLLRNDAYEFTMMLAFARLYQWADTAKVGNINNVLKDAWRKAGLHEGLPRQSGSGERAAERLAHHVAELASIPKEVAVAA